MYARDLKAGQRFQFVNAFGNVPVSAPVYTVTRDAQRASEPGYWIVHTNLERWAGRGRSPVVLL